MHCRTKKLRKRRECNEHSMFHCQLCTAQWTLAVKVRRVKKERISALKSVGVRATRRRHYVDSNTGIFGSRSSCPESVARGLGQRISAQGPLLRNATFRAFHAWPFMATSCSRLLFIRKVSSVNFNACIYFVNLRLIPFV